MAIEHTVVFRLIHDVDSDASDTFLADARAALSAIPGVEDFRIRRQVSPKSALVFQFSMVFVDEAAYAAYNDHPLHVSFVADRWVPEVAEFQEYDFVAV